MSIALMKPGLRRLVNRILKESTPLRSLQTLAFKSEPTPVLRSEEIKSSPEQTSMKKGGCNYAKSIKKALLVGCNYPAKGWPQLKGCYNDVNAIHETLITSYGFSPNNIQVLTDAPDRDSHQLPTGINIKWALKNMISEIGEGGTLFFHFSGHGTRFPFNKRYTEEAIVPSDGNFITKMDFRYLVNLLPKGATCVFFVDCRHSGDLFDQEKEQIGPNTLSRNGDGEIQLENCRFVPYETVLAALDSSLSKTGIGSVAETDIRSDIRSVMMKKFTSEVSFLFFGPRCPLEPLKSDQVILLSACQSNEQAYESQNDKGDWYGVFSLAVQTIIKEKLLSQPFSNKELVMKAMEIVPNLRKQHPCLYCSDDNVHRNFLAFQS